MTVPNGEFGGVVVRSLKTAGRIMQPGEEITPEQAKGWPIANRVALSNSGQVRWHTRPNDDEAVAKAEPVADAEQAEDAPRRGRPPKSKE